MTPLAIITFSFFAGLFGLGAKMKKPLEQAPPTPPPQDPTKPPPGAHFASVPGYRRAKATEVDSGMLQKARDALKHPLGTVLLSDGYAVALESHFNNTKGWHKGASIFILGKS